MKHVVLVTGGLGFIGSHVARELLRRGHEAVLLDVSVNDTLVRDIRDKVKIVKGDLMVPSQLAEAIETYDVDTLIHYAALKSSVAEADPQMAFRSNFQALWETFETARKMDVGTILFASSVAAYGPDVPQVAKEDAYTVPHTLYGVSKRFGEMLGLWFHRKYGIEFAAFRYGSVVGPGRRDGGASAYTTLIIQKPAQGEPYIANVPEGCRIPVVYVKDAVEATLLACERMKGLKSRIYNLVSLIPSPSAKEIAEMVGKHVPNAEVTFKPDPKTTEIVGSWPRDLDVSCAMGELGWKPKYGSLDVLVEDFVSEVQRHPEMYTI